MELSIVRFLNAFGRTTIDPFTELFCQVPFLVALWIGCALIAVRRDKENGKRATMTMVAALALHFVISEGLLKHALVAVSHMRIRPYLADPSDIVPVGTRFTDSSFPSSHMASTAAALTALTLYFPRGRPAAFAFVLLMAFCRMHNGMHYPTDVTAGALLGLGYGWLAKKIVERYAPSSAAAAVVAVAPPEE
ncbi:MAG: phosphatase PAP2 family protein [Polyangiaceae bacterium]